MNILLKTAAAAATLFYFCLSQSLAADLTITVDNLRSNQGQVLLCVFSSESSDREAFPDCIKGHPVRQGKAVIGDGKVVVTYKGLKDGVYAVAAIHDENANGELDTNFLGIPTKRDWNFNQSAAHGQAAIRPGTVRDQRQVGDYGQRQVHSFRFPASSPAAF